MTRRGPRRRRKDRELTSSGERAHLVEGGRVLGALVLPEALDAREAEREPRVVARAALDAV
jgi:hypothetical protein